MNDYYTNQHLNIEIKGFCLYSDEELAKLKDQLNLKSDIRLLKSAQEYFGNTEGRDPGSEELIFIDHIASSEPRSTSHRLLTELYAENLYIGETYDDMKEKLISLGKMPPYSFLDIGTAGELCCNEFCGRRNDTPINMYSGDSSLLKASVLGNISTKLIKSKLGGNSAISPYDNRQSYKNVPVIENSDSIIFVNSSTPTTMPADRMIPALSGLLINLRAKIQLKAVALTEGGNLLNAILSVAPGAFVNLTSLPGMIYNFSSTALLDSFENSAIVVVSSSSTNEFLSEAKEHGFGAIAFGHPNATNRLTVSMGAGHPISLSTAYLSEIKPCACMSVNITNTSDSDSAPCSDFSVMGFTESFYANYVTASSNLLITNAKKVCMSYGDAIGVVLECMCRLISCGVSRKDITASFESTVNTLADKETLGESLAMLLGLYRVQTELAIRSNGSSCHSSFTPSISATFAAPMPEKIIQNSFAAPNSKVYLLSPRNDANGIPEFRDIKLLLDYIEDLRKYGLILSARAVNGSDVIGTAKAMENGYIKVNISAKNANCAHGAFIIESTHDLQGTFLGFTE